MANGVLVDGSAAPTPCTADGREEVGANAAFDLHVLRIPSSFLVGLAASGSLGGFAFGLRASLFDRTCPLAIVAGLHPKARRLPRNIFRCTRIETRFQPVEQTGPCSPGVGAALKSGAHVIVWGRCSLLAVRRRHRSAAVRTIFWFLPDRTHLAFRFAAASASRTFEYR